MKNCRNYERIRGLRRNNWLRLCLFQGRQSPNGNPVFGNSADTPASVTLFESTGLSSWIRIVFAVLIGVTVLNGICGIIIGRFDKPVWNHHRLVIGMVLSITGAAVFIMTRQPYAGILCLAMLVVKGLLIGKGKGVS